MSTPACTRPKQVASAGLAVSLPCAHSVHPFPCTQTAEAAEDVHRLVGAASGQLKALKGGAAAVAGAASPLADLLDTCLQPLAAAGGYAQVPTTVFVQPRSAASRHRAFAPYHMTCRGQKKYGCKD